MKASRIELAQFIAAETQKTRLSSNFSEKLAGYLLAEHSSGELERVMHDVLAIRFERGFIEAVVRSVRPLSAETRTRITQLLKRRYPKSKQITLVEKLDLSLIGGISIQLPDERLDLSAAGRIRNFRRAVAKKVAA